MIRPDLLRQIADLLLDVAADIEQSTLEPVERPRSMVTRPISPRKVGSYGRSSKPLAKLSWWWEAHVVGKYEQLTETQLTQLLLRMEEGLGITAATIQQYLLEWGRLKRLSYRSYKPISIRELIALGMEAEEIGITETTHQRLLKEGGEDL